MSVCMYVSIHVCIHAYKYKYVHSQVLYVCVHAYKYKYVHTHSYTNRLLTRNLGPCPQLHRARNFQLWCCERACFGQVQVCTILCVRVWLYIRADLLTFLTYSFSHTHTRTHSYTYTHTHTHTRTHTHTHIHTCTHTHSRVHGCILALAEYSGKLGVFSALLYGCRGAVRTLHWNLRIYGRVIWAQITCHIYLVCFHQYIHRSLFINMGLFSYT